MAGRLLALCVIPLFLVVAVPASAEWTSFGGITQLVVVPDGQYLRIGVSQIDGAAASGAAGCASTAFIDVLLGEGETDEFELMYSVIQMAFLTYRDVRFEIREDTCSSTDSSTTIPVAVSVHVKH